LEIIKSAIDNKAIRIDIGLEYSEEKKGVNGPVEFDIENQSRFVDVINSILDEGVVNIVVNMQLVSYIDSSGLWALFEAYKKASQKNGNLFLLSPTKDVKRVLDITKMSSKIPIITDEKELADHINKKAQ